MNTGHGYYVNTYHPAPESILPLKYLIINFVCSIIKMDLRSSSYLVRRIYILHIGRYINVWSQFKTPMSISTVIVKIRSCTLTHDLIQFIDNIFQAFFTSAFYIFQFVWLPRRLPCICIMHTHTLPFNNTKIWMRKFDSIKFWHSHFPAANNKMFDLRPLSWSNQRKLTRKFRKCNVMTFKMANEFSI